MGHLPKALARGTLQFSTTRSKHLKGLRLTSLNSPSTNLLEEFRTTWQAGASLSDALLRLVVETNARAAGCWRLNERQLHLVGFGWASDMPAEVSQGFQDATRQVSLDQNDLGIVRAVLSDRPTVALLDPKTTGLVGSASWIAKFQANSSLAMPIRDQNRGTILGAFAVSTVSFVTEGDPLWNALLRISQELGR